MLNKKSINTNEYIEYEKCLNDPLYWYFKYCVVKRKNIK